MVAIQETGKLEVANNSFLVVAGIPAFNEEKTIARVVLNAQRFANIVIVCDDGSADLTCEIAERLGAVVIRHGRNLGYGAALQSLFKRASALKADVLVTFDSDGQHDPVQIPLLVKPIQEGIAEVVIGSRFMENTGSVEMPRYRKFGIKVITALSNGSSKNSVSDAQSGFRAYSKLAIEKLGNFSENGMSASIELLQAISRTDLRVFEVPISCKYGDCIEGETSTKHPISHGFGLLMYLLRLIVEKKPITFLGIPGVVALVLGTLFGVWMMNIYVVEQRIVTNIALASITFIFIGFFLMSTAIMLFAIRISKKVP